VKKSQAIGECFTCVWFANLKKMAQKSPTKYVKTRRLKGGRVAHIWGHFLQRDT